MFLYPRRRPQHESWAAPYTFFISALTLVMSLITVGIACLEVKMTLGLTGLVTYMFSFMFSDLVLQTTPITILLMSFSVLNTYNLSTRTKHYQFLRRQDPISSPNANFVVTKMDLERLERPSWGKRIRLNLWYALSLSWRFLFGMQLPHSGSATKEVTSKVQELEVWMPSEMETELFSIYSPAHALLWLAIGSTNWLLSILIMGLVSLQVCHKKYPELNIFSNHFHS